MSNSTMKYLIALALVVMILTGCSKEVEVTVHTETPSPVINQMSIHLFDLPDSLSEAEYLVDIERLNSFYTQASHPKNYTVFKVSEDADTETYRYALVSSYESAEQYEQLHDLGEEYEAFMDTLVIKHQDIIDAEIYRKVFRISTP